MQFAKSLVYLSILCFLSFAALDSAATGQSKVALATCEDIQLTKTHVGLNTVETANCLNPTTTFKPKDTLQNVFIVSTFPAMLNGAAITFVVTTSDAEGEYVNRQNYQASPHHTTAYIKVTINTPGKYFVRMMNYDEPYQEWATATFSVEEGKTSPRVTGNSMAGKGKVTICKEIDDNWKCVGESNEWKANVPFNILFENQSAVGVDFIGIVFHKQDARGKDVEFVNEYQQNIGEKNRKYATVSDGLRLPAGVYSVYILDWRKREVFEHRGNFPEYFAKTTLTVK